MTSQDSFREQVRQLVAEGKLSPEEARALLGPDVNFEPPQPPQAPQAAQAPQAPQAPTPPPAPAIPTEPEAAAPVAPDLLPVEAPDEDEMPSSALSLVPAEQVPPKLILQVAGYSLNVRAGDVSAPQLTASVEGRLELLGTPEGWLVRRTPVSWSFGGEEGGDGGRMGTSGTLDAAGRWVERVVGNLLQEGSLRGELVVPAGMTSVTAKVQGGNLTLPDFEAPVRVTVQGGNLTLGNATQLRAKVQGGNLKWNAVVAGGDHSLKVQGGNVNVNFEPGSSVRLDGDVTAGNMSASGFEVTRQARDFVNASYSGVLGGGAANLALTVQGGNARVVAS